MSPDDFPHFWKINNYASPNYKFDWSITSLFLCFEWSYVVLEALAPSDKFYHVSNHEALLGEINELFKPWTVDLQPFTFAYAHAYAYAHADAYVYAYVCIYACICICICICTCIVMCICVNNNSDTANNNNNTNNNNNSKNSNNNNNNNSRIM